MIAGKDENLNEASSELFKLCAELAVREECEARERYYREKKRLSELEKEVAEKDKLLAKSKKDIARKKRKIDALNDENRRLQELLKQNNIPL